MSFELLFELVRLWLFERFEMERTLLIFS